MNKYIFTIFLSLSLNAFSAPAVLENADAGLENKATALTVEPNKGKIYFINGNDLFFTNPKVTHLIKSDLFINDTFIGSPQKKENVLVVDLLPGTYEFHWLPTGIEPNSKMVPEKIKLNVEAGKKLVIQGDYNDGKKTINRVLGFGGGLFGALLSDAGSKPSTSIAVATEDDVKNKTVVNPTNCKPPICGN
jgi:hypothetical protein